MEIEIKPHFPPRKVCIASFSLISRQHSNILFINPGCVQTFVPFAEKAKEHLGSNAFWCSCLYPEILSQRWRILDQRQSFASRRHNRWFRNCLQHHKDDFEIGFFNKCLKHHEEKSWNIFVVVIFTRFVNVQDHFTHSERCLHSIFDCDWFQLSKAINQLFPGGIVRNNKSSIKPLNYLLGRLEWIWFVLLHFIHYPQ